MEYSKGYLNYITDLQVDSEMLPDRVRTDAKKLSRIRLMQAKQIELHLLIDGWDVNHNSRLTYEAKNRGVRLVVDPFDVRIFICEKIRAQVPILKFSLDAVDKFLE